jgi:4-hydroxybenzoate polyprenyltransferase
VSPTTIIAKTGFKSLSSVVNCQSIILAGFCRSANQLANPVTEVAPCRSEKKARDRWRHCRMRDFVLREGTCRMSVTTVQMPRLSTLLRLGRISNVPTVWTNVLAGSVIAGGGQRPDQIALLATAMTAFYVGGMYLNDFFDRAVDARDRPGRPIDAGEIRASTVSLIGFGLLAVGVVLMIPFGLAPMIWGALLAAVIVLYDVWHKGNALSPLVMGSCRALVYIATGAAVAGSTSHATMVGAIALASHVAGITYAAKQESLDRVGNLWPLVLLAVPLLAALPALFSGWTVVAFLLLLAADALAIRLLAKRPVPGSVPLAVSGLIAAICLVDALAIALNAGGILLVAICALGYPLTRLFQKSIPGT